MLRAVRSSFTALLGLLLMGPTLLTAQQLPLDLNLPLPGVTGYSDAIPKPEAVIGHRIGTQHTAPHDVVRYFEAVAAASDRVTLHEHARSYEGRPLIHAIVTSPPNHGRLEEIRQANLALSERSAQVSDAALRDQPAVVLMGYSVHGDEASGTEAAMLLLYHLAAGSGPGVEEVLANTVTLIDPMFNPDGRDRFVDWVNRHRGGIHTTDLQDLEHNEPWPGGRTNHYWFDLNRDWLPAQHPESQGRLEVFHRWRPQVLTDYHEMGKDATYFFQPGIPSRTNPNTPDLNQELTGRIAAYHAEALDRLGSLYYTEESFDDFYYGKGSTYPDLNGAVGILFEQASSQALESETVHGDLHYAFTIRNQASTSLSTLRAVVTMREDLLRYHRDFYAQAADVVRAFPVKAYVIRLDKNRTRAQALAEVLQRHRVRVHELARSLEVDGTTYQPGAAYVVPVDQQQARLIKAFMERTTEYSDSLFYDVSTWTLPLAFNVDYAALRNDPSRYVGAELDATVQDGGQLIGGRSDYAYVMEWGRYFAPRALYHLQAAGVRPRLLKEPFAAEADGQQRTFARGTIVIPVQQDGLTADSVYALVQQAVANDHVRIHAVSTGLTPEGPDFGSRGAKVLEQPRIGLLVGEGTRAYNAGEVWHLLSERFEVPVSLLDVERVEDADLDHYNTLVLAGGSYRRMPAKRMRNWVDRGGHLIAFGSAVDWVVDEGLLDLEKRDGADLDSLLREQPYAQLDRARAAQYIGGTIFETSLDVTHPLAYGYDERAPVFRRGTTFYEPADTPGTNVARYVEDPLLSGYVSEERLEAISGSAALVAGRHGRGRVILMMFNPNFRAFWYGTNGLFLNAVFLGGAY